MNNLTFVHHLLVSMSVRLNTGSDATVGGVEVSKDGLWYGICDTNFDITAARVVCRGINQTFVDATVIPGSAFGVLSGGSVFADVRCTGNETELSECTVEFNSTCTSGYYVSVFCSNTTLEDTDIHVRISLDKHASKSYGIVEVRVHGVWGKVCLHDFDDQDAAVICRSLGNEDGIAYLHVERNNKPILMRGVECSGNETSLSQCPNRQMSPDLHNCNYDSADAGVICFNKTDNTGFGYRLTGGDGPSNGRVEIGHAGRWGVVCAKAWISADAQVLCRSLGYKDGIVEYTINKSLPHRAPWVNGFYCQGVETTLMTCLNTGFNISSIKSHLCLGDYGLGAYTSCYNDTVEPTEVRLADGPNSFSGRVEVFVTGVNSWGTICDDYWDEDDAVVVCKQLGFYGGTALRNAPYGPGTGPIWFDNMKCKGNESSLFECSHRGIGTHNCNHTEDVGVICLKTTPATEPVRRSLSSTRTSRIFSSTTISTLPITSGPVALSYESPSAPTDSIHTRASVITTNSQSTTRPTTEITTKSPVTQSSRTPEKTTDLRVEISTTTSCSPVTRADIPESSYVAAVVSVIVPLLFIIALILLILRFKRGRKITCRYSREGLEDSVVSYCSDGTSCADNNLYELNQQQTSDGGIDDKIMFKRNANAYYSRELSNCECKSESFTNPLNVL